MIIKKNEKGFTLIELMIVIAIIGILAAVAIPNYIAFKNKSYCTATVNDTLATAAALADYLAIPSTVSATILFTPAAVGGRPFINVGNLGIPAANTLVLSASTSAATAAQPAGSSSYLITVTEGGNCPTKVTSAENHWTVTAAGNTYAMTL